MPQLSVVVPVYNEGANIAPLFAAIEKNIKPPYEVLVVYDHDWDNTIAAVEKARKEKPDFPARLVKNNVAPGASGALRSGFAAAGGTEILVTMADLSDDLAQVELMRERLRSGYDLVCPSRYCAGGRQELSGLRADIPRLAGRIMTSLFGFPLADPTNSFRLYSKKALAAMTLRSTHSFSVTLEIAAKAHLLGLRFLELPTVWTDRKAGKSKFPFAASLASYLPWFFLAAAGRPLQPFSSRRK